jgi:hypothetical protein
MRILTLTQPWATLVATGAKRIETRSWSTAYRGPVAIHAGKGLGPVGGKIGLQALCAQTPFKIAIYPEILQVRTDANGNEWPSWDLDRLSLGAIVAVATLCNCVPILIDPDHWRDAVLGDHWPLTWQEYAFGDYSPGRYAWLLSDVRRLRTPIPWRGAQGLRDVPELAQIAIEEQLR